MSVTIKPNKMKYKDSSGNYVGVNAIAERTTAEEVADIQAVSTTAQGEITALTTAKKTEITNLANTKKTEIDNKATEVTSQLANAAEVRNMLAGTFSTSTNYTKGQYVIQTVTVSGNSVNKLYRFTADHPAGNWLGTDVVEVKLADDVSSLSSAISNTDDVVFEFDSIPVNATATGWRLNESDGLCSSDAGYKLVKYQVNAGNYVRVETDDRFQFQNSASVPSSGTNNRIGKTYQGSISIVKVPDGATYLIVSSTTDGVQNAYKGTGIDNQVNGINSALLQDNNYINKISSLDQTITEDMSGSVKNKRMPKSGIPVNESGFVYKIFTYLGGSVTTVSNDRGNGCIAFFDKDMTPIQNSGTNWDIPAIIVVPEGAVFFSISLTTSGAEGTTVTQSIQSCGMTRKGFYNGLSETNLNNVLENGSYMLVDSYSYTNKPSGFPNLGFLDVIFTGNWHLQILYPFEAVDEFYFRRGNSNGSAWGPWLKIASGASSISDLTILDLNSSSIPEGWWILTDSHEYTNKPTGFPNVGFLNNRFTGNWRIQLLYQFDGGNVYKRRGNAAGTTWEAWRLVSSGNVYNVTNENTYNTYSQTVTLNATPTIEASTNDYLASTNDTTDRTADILAMLTATGICRLGPGTFYIKDLQMPANSSIIGSGFATEVHMIWDSSQGANNDGSAIIMARNCRVSDIRLIGQDNDPSFSAQAGERHGILWQGAASTGGTVPARGQISGVYIYKFSGGGITCYNTGAGTSCALEVINAYITTCWAGINIPYYSEFHKFTNVRCDNCRIGCLNNGGNNIFVNCDFSTSQEIAMLMDNVNYDAYNNSHGSCIGCTFNHTLSEGTLNKGIGIKILNCESGFVFDGCQIFYSKIQIEDSDGITFSSCNFGYSNCDIDVDTDGSVLFIGDMFQQKPTINIHSSPNVHFINCYNRSTGASITP